MKKFAVFDFDGTLIRWQLYHAVVDELAHEGLVDKKSYEDVKIARHKWRVRESQNSYKNYEHQLINCYNKSLPNLTKSQLDKAIQKVFEEHREQVYVYTRGLINDLKQKNYFLIAISGSHREIVEMIAKYYGFNDWVGAKYEVVEQKFTGKSQLPSREKDKVLKNLIKEHDLVLAESFGVGDSESDIPMLEMVENPIAFNPTQKLLDHAKIKGWKIVIERKNVVYELTQNTHEKYILS